MVGLLPRSPDMPYRPAGGSSGSIAAALPPLPMTAGKEKEERL